MGEQLARARFGQVHEKRQVLIMVKFAPFLHGWSRGLFTAQQFPSLVPGRCGWLAAPSAIRGGLPQGCGSGRGRGRGRGLLRGLGPEGGLFAFDVRRPALAFDDFVILLAHNALLLSQLN